MKIVIIDTNEQRREVITNIISGNKEFLVESRAHISREDFENGVYDLALVHYNNIEGPKFEGSWDISDTKLILFSGNFIQNIAKSDDIYYASARYVQNYENLLKLMKELI